MVSQEQHNTSLSSVSRPKFFLAILLASLGGALLAAIGTALVTSELKDLVHKSANTAVDNVHMHRSLQDNEVLIFEETFETLDLRLWKHDITLAGGGNWEFQAYENNRTNSFVEEGVLHLRPTLTSDIIGKEQVSGKVAYNYDVWGMTPADKCTTNAFYGCSRTSDYGGRHPINPITSAKLTTAGTFSFTYGRVEVVAKMPRGDWLWPAVWLLPEDNAYGKWPQSGEIDLLESRGNSPSYVAGGFTTVGSTLHWGPYSSANRFETTSKSKPVDAQSADRFHTYGLLWTENSIITYMDTEDNVILNVPFTQGPWQRGGFPTDGSQSNPWKQATSLSAPFDHRYYLILNLAVGGVSGFFPDDPSKPWSDKDGDAAMKFLEASPSWLPTWGKGKDFLISSIRVWQDKDRLDYHLESDLTQGGHGDSKIIHPTGAPVKAGLGYTETTTEDEKIIKLEAKVSSLMMMTALNSIVLLSIGLAALYGTVKTGIKTVSGHSPTSTRYHEVQLLDNNGRNSPARGGEGYDRGEGGYDMDMIDNNQEYGLSSSSPKDTILHARRTSRSNLELTERNR